MNYHDPDGETIQLYVAGSLAEAESTAFEKHLLTCDACRNEVRMAAALRRELVKASAPRKSRTILAGAAVAATLALMLVRLPGDSLSRFGAVASAPGYEGIAVRATDNAADAAFSATMSHYQRGAYRESADGFRAARAAGADSVITTFFLGASLLMSGRAEEAADEFGRASRMGRNAYAGESHFYHAKALLRLGDAKAALAELAAAAAIESPVQAQAQALTDSIQGGG